MKSIVQEIRPKINEIFNHLHQNPEVSWKEFETTKFIKQFLENHQWKTTTFPDCTGVIGELGTGKPVIAVRADLDALWQEVDGVFRANHSCGHDGHMTMVLGSILMLEKLMVSLPGTLKLIFQPAEEKGTGALKMVEKGVVDDVDYLFGVHLRPFQEVENGKASPAILHGSAKFLAGKITGSDVHGARPHLGPNAVEVAADIVTLLKGIHLDPVLPYSVKMTKLVADGGGTNIIPGSAEFSLDLRAQTNDLMSELTKKVDNIIHQVATIHGTSIQLNEGAFVAAAETNEEAQKLMEKAIIESLGTDHLVSPSPTSGGEDFHFYTFKRKHLKATMLGLGCGLKPGLHDPKMEFNQNALLTGIEILTRVVLLAFEKESEGRN